MVDSVFQCASKGLHPGVCGVCVTVQPRVCASQYCVGGSGRGWGVGIGMCAECVSRIEGMAVHLCACACLCVWRYVSMPRLRPVYVVHGLCHSVYVSLCPLSMLCVCVCPCIGQAQLCPCAAAVLPREPVHRSASFPGVGQGGGGEGRGKVLGVSLRPHPTPTPSVPGSNLI